jgi:acyl-CoA reductase-like NAD-dependent aldehyde dehydrogenase
MRSAILQMPSQRTANERRRVFRTAIRQLDRAAMYLAAVAYMDLEDRPAQRVVGRLRADIENLKRHLAELRAETSD